MEKTPATYWIKNSVPWDFPAVFPGKSRRSTPPIFTQGGVLQKKVAL